MVGLGSRTSPLVFQWSDLCLVWWDYQKCLSSLVCFGRGELQLPDVAPEDTSITVFHMTKRRKLSISEFERAAERRLPQYQGKAAVKNYLAQCCICCQLVLTCSAQVSGAAQLGSCRFGIQIAISLAKGMMEKVKACILSNLKWTFLSQVLGSAMTIYNFLTTFATWCFLSFEVSPEKAIRVFFSVLETFKYKQLHTFHWNYIK